MNDSELLKVPPPKHFKYFDAFINGNTTVELQNEVRLETCFKFKSQTISKVIFRRSIC